MFVRWFFLEDNGVPDAGSAVLVGRPPALLPVLDVALGVKNLLV